MRLKNLIIACALVLSATSAAEARRHHQAAAPVCNNPDIMRPCVSVYNPDIFSGIRSMSIRMKKDKRAAVNTGFFAAAPAVSEGRVRIARGNAQIVAHPSGCPSRAFCGCGAAVRVFGTPRRDLWLARAWLRFPRTTPAAGMVAARSGHVFVLEAHLGGDVWQVYDANSGGHATRIHARSIAGYSIVNPHA